MTPQEQQERKEECRREALRFLANRSVLAFRAETVLLKLNKEHDFTIEEVKAALEFERGAGRISLLPNKQGADRFYKVTTEGMLFHENTP
jgi:hypothetical protein